MFIMKIGKIEGSELRNQQRIRTFREKVNYKYLGILEADTFKQEEMKEKKKKKKKKNISDERENSTDPNFAAEISWKG